MSVSVGCPRCGQVLLAPDELLGKLAACPQCNTQFPVTMPGKRGNGQPAAPPPSATSSAPSPASAPHSSALESPPIRASDPPPTAKAPARESFYPPTKSAAPASRKGPAQAAEVAATAPTPAAARTSPTKTPTPAAPATKPTGTTRIAQAARFVAAEATDTAIQLGQDGQLPTLVVEEGAAKPDSEGQEQKSKPWLLIAVVGCSLLASIAMLILETETQRSEAQEKSSARAALEQHYLRSFDSLRLESYQRLLREALQAHHRDDDTTEKARYREVLLLLHAENNNQLQGLTGSVRANAPPNDEDLARLLSILLRDE